MVNPSDLNKHRNEPFDPRRSALTPPTSGVFDLPSTAIVLNVQWRAFLDGMLERLLWRDVWAGDDIDKDNAIQAITDLLASWTEEIGGMFQLRQSPTNPLVMEQSVDGGDTWIEAFNFGVLTLSNDVSLAASKLQTWQTITTPASINPNAPPQIWIQNVTTDNVASDARIKALCYAIKQLVDFTIRAAMEVNNATVTGLTLAGAATAIGAAVFATVVSAGAGIPLLLGLVSAGLGTAGIIWDAITETIAGDDSAREEVECLIFDRLKSSNVAFNEFKNAFTDSGALSGNALIIFNAIKAAVSTNEGALDVYNAFLNYTSDLYKSAKLGVLTENCLCVDDCSPYFWNFAVAPLWRAVNADYVAGQGWWTRVGQTGSLTLLCPQLSYGHWGLKLPRSGFASNGIRVIGTVINGVTNQTVPALGFLQDWFGNDANGWYMPNVNGANWTKLELSWGATTQGRMNIQSIRMYANDGETTPVP